MKSRNELIIKKYQEGTSSPDIAKELNLTTARVCQILKENSIQTRPVYKFETDIPTLIKEYNSGKTTYDLGKKHSIDASVIQKLLKANGVTLRKSTETSRMYSINDTLYDVIDTEEKAYFLGLLFADGSSKGNCASIRLALQEKDIELVEKFRDMFGYTKPLYFTKGHKSIHRMVTCEITNKKVSQALYNWGIVPRKTFVTKFPEKLDPQFHPAFIRGYFDGDGSISISKDGKRASFSIAGSEPFLLRIQEILIKNCGMNPTKLIPHKQIHTINYGGNIQLIRIREFLYKDATLFLQRKKDKFDSIEVLHPVAKPKKPTKAHWNPNMGQVQALLKEGKSYREIADILGTYHTKITRMLKI